MMHAGKCEHTQMNRFAHELTSRANDEIVFYINGSRFLPADAATVMESFQHRWRQPENNDIQDFGHFDFHLHSSIQVIEHSYLWFLNQL